MNSWELMRLRQRSSWRLLRHDTQVHRGHGNRLPMLSSLVLALLVGIQAEKGKLLSFIAGIRSYLRQTVSQCRQKGYVETMGGRRRYLPAIRDTNPHARAHVSLLALEVY